MWKSTFTKTQDKEKTTATAKYILAQTTKPKLSKHYHTALFIPKKTITIKPIKQGFSRHFQNQLEV